MGALRESDIKSLLRLASEVGELPRHHDLRLGHLLEGLGKLIGARIVGWGRVAYEGEEMRPRVIRVLDRGWTTPGEHEGFIRYVSANLNDDPMKPPVTSFMKANWGLLPVITTWRRHYTSAEWDRQPFVQEIFRPNGLGEALYIIRSIPGTNQSVGVAITREWGDRTPFNGREFKLAELLCESLGHLFEEDGAVRISPRATQVLERLIAGDSAKEIAAKLKLSVHTINEHIHAIYRAYGVSTRGELMAQFVNGNQTGRLSGSSPS